MKAGLRPRWQQTQAWLRQKRCRALWVVQAANRRYLTGFTGSAGWVLLPSQGRPLLITDGRYQEQARKECPGVAVAICQKDAQNCLSEYLRQQGVRTLAFEDDRVAVKSWREMRRACPRVRWVEAAGLIERLRQRKSQDEISCLRRAIRLAETAYARIYPRIKPGLREIDLAQRLEQALHEAGGQGLAFPTIVASGPNSALPHAKPTTRKIRRGDLLVMDFGTIYKGYHSDLTRTVAVGKITPKQREIYKLVKKAQKEAKKAIISDAFSSESDKKAREIFKNKGLEEHFVHSLGHGLGLEIHEAPRLSIRSREKLASGMVVTCEPGLYLPGWGGIRIEDDVLVTSHASQWLSRSPEDLPLVGR
ncbi:MAG: Xaa-Pro peptidase family protein [candidate division FCPU426 bacterium]